MILLGLQVIGSSMAFPVTRSTMVDTTTGSTLTFPTPASGIVDPKISNRIGVVD